MDNIEMNNLLSIYQHGWLMAALEAARNGAEPAMVDALLGNSRQTAAAIISEQADAINEA